MKTSERTRRTKPAALLACALSVCALFNVSNVCAHVVTQARAGRDAKADARKDSNRDARKGTRAEDAARARRELRESVVALKDAAELARSFEDVYESVRTQAEAADALWPFDEQTARSILRRAWDAANAPGAEEHVEGFGTSEDPREDALNTLTTARGYVVKTAVKHDARLGQTFMREFERGLGAREPPDADARANEVTRANEDASQSDSQSTTTARPFHELSHAGWQRLNIARQLVEEEDFKHAVELVAPLTAEGASPALLKFILELRERDERDADALYLRLIETTLAVAGSGVNDLLLLSTPIISPQLLVSVGAGGSANFTPLHYESDAARRAAASMPAPLRRAFYESAAAWLLRVGPTSEEPAALYFALNRLLPFFERESPQLAPALHARLSSLAADIESARRASLDSQSSVRSLTSKNPSDPLDSRLLNVEGVRDTAERDFMRLSAVLSAARGGLWERARKISEEIEDAEARRAARLGIAIHQVMSISRAYGDEDADDFTRASDFVRAADVPSEVRAAGLAQAAELAAHRGKRSVADALFAEAASYAAQSDRGQQRVAAFALITLSASRAGASRVWELLSSLARESNASDDLRWSALNFTFTLGGERKIEFGLPLPAPSLTDVFAATARLDALRTFTEARALEDEEMRATALISAARVALAKRSRASTGDKAR
jgi:hypothetical protein